MSEQRVWHVIVADERGDTAGKPSNAKVRFAWPNGAVEEFTAFQLRATIAVLVMQCKPTTEYQAALAELDAFDARNRAVGAVVAPVTP
jgi:hypothetical protein